jgi:hypothetical protein
VPTKKRSFEERAAELKSRIKGHKRADKAERMIHAIRPNKKLDVPVMTREPFGQTWERHIEEASEIFDDFQIYLYQGPTRSFQRTSRATGKSLNTIVFLATQGRWAERARAYDDHLRKERDEVMVREQKAEMLDRTYREVARRAMGWDLSEGLHAQAMEMLAAPLYAERVDETEEYDEKGKRYIIRTVTKTPKFNLRDMAATVEAFAKLSALAVVQDSAKPADGAPAGQLIAGSFRLFEGQPEEPPPLVVVPDADLRHRQDVLAQFELPPLEDFPKA